jgi:hypothetical protein
MALAVKRPAKEMSGLASGILRQLGSKAWGGGDGVERNGTELTEEKQKNKGREKKAKPHESKPRWRQVSTYS